MSETKELTVQSQPAGIQLQQELTLSEAAELMAKSGFFLDAKQASQAAVKLIIGQELGLSIVASMKGIHVFDGNIELATTTMATLIKRSGVYRVTIIKANEEGCELAFKELIQGDWYDCGPAVGFTMAEAQRAGLAGKNNWKNYPADMCYSRALSRGFRRYCPELAGGPVYVQGETSDPSEPVHAIVRVVEPAPKEQGPEAPKAAPEAQAAGSGSDNAQDAQEPADHPYARFIAKCQKLKDRIGELDGGSARYYTVFGIHGFENKGQVPKSDTKAMREIVLDLMSAVEEAQAEKAALVAETLDGDEEKAGSITVVKEWPLGPELLETQGESPDN